MKGKGWHELADHTGKAPEHVAAATRTSMKDTLRTPFTSIEERQPNVSTISDAEFIPYLRRMSSIPISKSYIDRGVKVSGGFGYLPVTYLRFGRPPQDNKPSQNWLTGKPEKGVSVIANWYDKNTLKYVITGEGNLETLENLMDKHKLYRIEGTPLLDSGEDVEPLLDPATVRIVNEVNPDDVVNYEDPSLTFGGSELSEQDTPDWENSLDLLYGSWT